MENLTPMLTEAANAATSNVAFHPENFIKNLSRMGIGMFVIFVIIGIIILTTVMVNKVFSDEK